MTASAEPIELRVADARLLFNGFDPLPLDERELDADVEDFIVARTSERSADAPLSLHVRVESGALTPADANASRQAVSEFFRRRADRARRRLETLFHVGRRSLAIGLLFFAACLALGEVLATVLQSGVGNLLRESLAIGGWVALWRPMEIFLYDWWPIRDEARRFDRLAAMPVRIECEGS